MRVRPKLHPVFDIALRSSHPRDLDIPPGTKPPNPEESERESTDLSCHAVLDHPDRVFPMFS